MKIYRSFSSRETKKLGFDLAKSLPAHKIKAERAAVFGLVGELGSGKTTFIQGFLRGLGVRRGGASPTFIIMRRHAIKNKNYKSVYHVDAYRIKKPRELGVLGFEKIIGDPGNVVLIEWAENIKKILPKNTFWLKFKHGKKENERRIL